MDDASNAFAVAKQKAGWTSTVDRFVAVIARQITSPTLINELPEGTKAYLRSIYACQGLSELNHLRMQLRREGDRTFSLGPNFFTTIAFDVDEKGMHVTVATAKKRNSREMHVIATYTAKEEKKLIDNLSQALIVAVSCGDQSVRLGQLNDPAADKIHTILQCWLPALLKPEKPITLDEVKEAAYQAQLTILVRLGIKDTPVQKQAAPKPN
jgi:hypothetical protein